MRLPGERAALLALRPRPGQVRTLANGLFAPDPPVPPSPTPHALRKRLDGVLLFFEAHLDESTKLSSAPWLTRTHWPQILYLSEESADVRAGQSLKLSVAYAGGKGLAVGLACRRHASARPLTPPDGQQRQAHLASVR